MRFLPPPSRFRLALESTGKVLVQAARRQPGVLPADLFHVQPNRRSWRGTVEHRAL